MKLLSCYIENYGTFSKKEFNFNSQITEFNLENGSGKTTLASFIKAMFYGLEGYTVTSKTFCERQRYAPFNGGEFGGNLTFEKDGIVYKIERFFGDKSTVNDTLTVYKNGEITAEFSDNVGAVVFGIDKKSFERTVFVSSDEIDISSTESINSKLGGVVQGVDDASISSAYKELELASKKYKKMRGGNDIITRETELISELKIKIANAEAIASGLEEKYENKSEIVKKIKELNLKIANQQSLNEKITLWENYESRKAQIKDKEAEFKECKKSLKNGIPTDCEIEALNELINEYYKINYELELLTATRESDEDKRLIATFENKVPSSDSVTQAENAISEYRAIASELKYIPETVAVSRPIENAKNKGGALKIAIAITAVLSAVGVGLMFINTVVGLALLGVGALGLIIEAFVYLNKKTSSTYLDILQVENPERRKFEDRQNLMLDVVKNLLMPYGYFSNKGVEFDFYKFKDDLNKYLQIKNHFNNVKVEVQNKLAKKSELANSIEREFKKYGEYSGDYKARLVALTSVVARCETLKNSLLKDQSLLETYKAEKALAERPEGEFIDLKALNGELDNLRTQLSVLSKQIEYDEDDASKLSDYLLEKENAEERLSNYKHRHKLLTAAYELIGKADDSMKEKYISPVKNEFIAYADLLEKTLGEKITMTKNLEISYERAGKLRTEKHLSTGQKCLLALCFRLAIVKNVFKGETPFFVLDDPFVSLDENHIEKATQLVEGLAEKHQIIYFTCHQSRSVIKRS